MKFMKYTASVMVLMIVGACTGSGTQDNSSFLSAVAGNDTLVIVQRASGYGPGTLIKVGLNSKRIGELGSWESISAKTAEGTNTLTAHYPGISAAFRPPHTRRFTMKAGQKRFFLLRDGAWDAVGVKEIVSLEVTRDEFFKSVAPKK